MIVSKTTAEGFLGKKLKSLGGGKRSYYVLSEAGNKNLGGPYTKEQAKDRLREVEFFKHKHNPSKPFFDRAHDWNEVIISNQKHKKTRKQILDHYKKYEKKIWPFLKDQTVMIIQGVGKNKFVRRRKRDSDDQYIKLTKLRGPEDESSLEYWLLRRTIEFHPILTSKRTSLAWIDLDAHKASAAQKHKLRAKMKNMVPALAQTLRTHGVSKVHVYESGTNGGIHLEGDLKRSKDVDRLRTDLTDGIKKQFAGDPVVTTGIAKPGQVRIDVTTLHELGSLRAPYSMTTLGGWKKEIAGQR